DGRLRLDSGRPAAAAVGADLPGSPHHITVAGQLLGPDRAASVQTRSGDADLAAEAELAAVRELGRGVPHDDRAVDGVEEGGCGDRVLSDDGLCVPRPVAADVLHCAFDA